MAVCWPTSVTEEEVELVETVEADVVAAGVMVAVLLWGVVALKAALILLSVLGSAKTPATFAMTAATNKRAMTEVTTTTLPVARLSPSLEGHRPFVNRPTECDPVRKKALKCFAISRGTGCILFSGFPGWFHNLCEIPSPSCVSRLSVDYRRRSHAEAARGACDFCHRTPRRRKRNFMTPQEDTLERNP